MALTLDGRVLTWGGSNSDSLSKRQSRLYNEKVSRAMLKDMETELGEEFDKMEQLIEENTELLMPLYQKVIS